MTVPRTVNVRGMNSGKDSTAHRLSSWLLVTVNHSTEVSTASLVLDGYIFSSNGMCVYACLCFSCDTCVYRGQINVFIYISYLITYLIVNMGSSSITDVLVFIFFVFASLSLYKFICLFTFYFLFWIFNF